VALLADAVVVRRWWRGGTRRREHGERQYATEQIRPRDLATGDKKEFERIRDFDFNGDNATWIAMVGYTGSRHRLLPMPPARPRRSRRWWRTGRCGWNRQRASPATSISIGSPPAK